MASIDLPPSPTPTATAAQAAATKTTTTSANTIRIISAIVAVIGPFVSKWDPLSGKISPTEGQAIVMIGCLVVAGLIFTVHFALAAVHEYGFNKLALTSTVSAEEAEIRSLLPVLKNNWATAKPALDKIPQIDSLTNDIQGLQARLTSLEKSPPA